MYNKIKWILFSSILFFSFEVLSASLEDEMKAVHRSPLLGGRDNKESGYIHVTPEVLSESRSRSAAMRLQRQPAQMNEWVLEQILTDSTPSKFEKNLWWFTLPSAALGSIVFFDLGYDFGAGAPLGKHANNPAGYALGFVSTVPIIVMGKRFLDSIMSETYKGITSNKTPAQRKIEDSRCYPSDLAIMGWRGIEGVIGTISAGPFTYLANSTLYPLMGAAAIPVFDVPTFYVKAIADIWALDALSGIILVEARNVIYRNLVDKSSIGFKRQVLHEKMEDARSIIARLGNDYTQALIAQWQANDEENRGIQVLGGILNLEGDLSRGGIHLSTKRESLLRKFLRFSGAVIGAVSMSAIEPVAQDSMRITWDSIGVHSEPLNQASDWGATAAAASLMSYATADSFGKLYDAMEYGFNKIGEWLYPSGNSEYARIGIEETAPTETMPSTWQDNVIGFLTHRGTIAAGSLVLAGVSSIPNVDLSLNYLGTSTVYDRFADACSVISPVAMNFWAIDDFLMSLKGRFDPRFSLYAKLDRLDRKIDRLNDEAVNFLYSLINRRGGVETVQ